MEEFNIWGKLMGFIFSNAVKTHSKGSSALAFHISINTLNSTNANVCSALYTSFLHIMCVCFCSVNYIVCPTMFMVLEDTEVRYMLSSKQAGQQGCPVLADPMIPPSKLYSAQNEAYG